MLDVHYLSIPDHYNLMPECVLKFKIFYLFIACTFAGMGAAAWVLRPEPKLQKLVLSFFHVEARGLIAGLRALLNPPRATEASLHYNESFCKRQRDNDALRPTKGGMFINGCLQTAARQNGGRPARQSMNKKAQGVRQSMHVLLACIQESDRKKGREMLQFLVIIS